MNLFIFFLLFHVSNSFTISCTKLISVRKISKIHTLPKFNKKKITHFNTTYHLSEHSNNNTIKKIDSNIFKIAKPAIFNYLMVPIVSMVDTFWVSKKGTAIDIASVGTADQIFFIFFSVLSFLPTLLTPKISNFYVKNQVHDISYTIRLSIQITIFLSLISSVLFFQTDSFVNLLVKSDNTLFAKTVHYLKIRSLSLPFCLFNSLIFSILRGVFDFNNAIKINILSQIVNLILDPIFIDIFGIKGAAISTLISDIICNIGYVVLLVKKQLLKQRANIKQKILQLKYFITMGINIQLRTFLLQFLYIYMNKKIINMDNTGIGIASHIIICKILNLADIIYRGLGMTSSSLIPNEKIHKNDKIVKLRILFFTTIVHIIQTLLYIFSCQHLHIFTTNELIIKNIQNLISISSIYLIFNGYNTVLEGLLQGHENILVPSYISFILYVPMFYFIHCSESLEQIWKYATLILGIKNIMFLYVLKKSENELHIN